MPTKAKRNENISIDIELEGRNVEVAIVRRSTARRYILRVRAANRDVQLTMPPYGSVREARAFAERHGDWLRARLAKLPRPRRFSNGSVVPYKGRDHVIEHHPEGRGTVWIEPGAANATVPEQDLPRLCVAGRAAHLRRRLRDWLKKEAEKALGAAVRKYARQLGVEFSRISIRDQKTRWGSCSANGTLAFSWRLIMAPTYVLDYLAAHEVVHLRHMDHSKRYWRTLRELCPATDRAEAWLKAHGRDLHRYDAD